MLLLFAALALVLASLSHAEEITRRRLSSTATRSKFTGRCIRLRRGRPVSWKGVAVDRYRRVVAVSFVKVDVSETGWWERD